MSYIVALTGGICSGKTTIANIFSKFSEVSVIDSDVIARKVVQPKSYALLAIAKYFGSNILLSNGELNRHALKQRIFLNSIEKKWLEKLLHPIIQIETQKAITALNHTSTYILWVVPLLIENNLQNQANRTLIVDIHSKIQLARLMKRDRINKQYAKSIILSQTTRQHRLKYAHDIIQNNYKIQDIQSKILLLHHSYIKLNHNQ